MQAVGGEFGTSFTTLNLSLINTTVVRKVNWEMLKHTEYFSQICGYLWAS